MSGINTASSNLYLRINKGQKALMHRTYSSRWTRRFDPPHPLRDTRICVEVYTCKRASEWRECYCVNSDWSGGRSVPRSLEISRMLEHARCEEELSGFLLFSCMITKIKLPDLHSLLKEKCYIESTHNAHSYHYETRSSFKWGVHKSRARKWENYVIFKIASFYI